MEMPIKYVNLIHSKLSCPKFNMQHKKTTNPSQNTGDQRGTGSSPEKGESNSQEFTIRMGGQFETEMSERLKVILNGINTGIWARDLRTGKEDWSDKFFEVLGYKRGELSAHYKSLEGLFHPDHRSLILVAVEEHFKTRAPFKHEVLMRHGSGEYRWYETIGRAMWDENGMPIQMAGSLRDVHNRKLLEQKQQNTELLLTEAGRIARLGAWEIDLQTMTPLWSEEVYRIHEVPLSYKPDMEEAISFYHPDYIDIINKVVASAIEEGTGWDEECKLITGKGREIWVRSKGLALMDDSGKCVALRGVFQNIDDMKNKEMELTRTLEMVKKQNDRLLDFAHIVSHNLRSHTSNLSSVFSTLKITEEESDKEELLEHINETAIKLDETINHLSEVVKIQSEVGPLKESVVVHEIYESVSRALEERIKNSKADIKLDFEVKEIFFVPSYFESIVKNLMSNAVKFRDPSRPLKIKLRTYKDAKTGGVVFSCGDNGSGIDLERQGHKIFGMYKTFHRNPESNGIGLFMIKNQIEAFGGSISVESEKGVGSTFTVCF